MKRKGILCVLFCLLLAGCGTDDKLLQYMDTTDIGMVDTKEEAEAYNKTLNRKDNLEWVYNEEKIRELLSLEKMLRVEVEKVNGQMLNNGDKLQEALSRSRAGTDFSELKQIDVQFTIETKDHNGMEKICAKLDEMGYAGMANCQWDTDFNLNGLFFNLTNLEEEGCEMLIQTPAGMLYYPEKYQEILKVLAENNFYAGRISCYGGPINQIAASNGDKNTLCRDIQLSLDQNGKVVELMAGIEKSGIQKVRSESEKTVLVEVLTNMTGNRNEAISFVRNFSRKDKKGKIAEEYGWTVEAVDETSCILKIQ